MIEWNGDVCVTRCNGCGRLAGPPETEDWRSTSLARSAGWYTPAHDRHYCPACTPAVHIPPTVRNGPSRLSDHWTGD